MTDDPGKKLMDKVRNQSEKIEWNGHMRSGDEIILMFTDSNKSETKYIEADEETVDQLIGQLRLAKQE